MRKLAVIVATIVLLLCCHSALADDVSVSFDGEMIEFDVNPCIIDGRTLVPVRGVFEAFGAGIVWDADVKMIYATSDDVSIWIQADNPVITYQKNGAMYSCKPDVVPCIINDRMFVPVRVISEIFEASVVWNNEFRTVVINTSGNEDISHDEPEFSVEGFEAPVETVCGQPFVMGGEIISNIPLDRMNVKVRDVESGEVEINETAFDIESTIYQLSDIDSRIRFGTLSVGEKLMEITVVNSFEDRETFSYEFSVIRPGVPEAYGEISMLWPVPSSGLITTVFWCDNVFCHSNEGRENGHAAIDIAANANEDVIAVNDGVVTMCGFGDYSNGHTGYGNFIVLDHGEGIITQYAHLNEIYVQEGESITAGQVIGAIGSTGRSTGNHLDFAIEKDGERRDPLYYLDIPENARCYEECDAKFFEEAMQIRGLK